MLDLRQSLTNSTLRKALKRPHYPLILCHIKEMMALGRGGLPARCP